MAVQTVTTMPPGPKGVPVLGNIFALQRKGILPFYYETWRTYGDAARVKLGPLTSFLFTRPEYVQHILVQNPQVFIKGDITHAKLRLAIGNGILTLEGERWFKQHKLMQPTYTRKGVNVFAEIMREEAHRLLERWDARKQANGAVNGAVNDAAVVDINQEMTQMTMSVISRAMFSIDIGTQYREAIDALYVMLEYTSQSTNSLVDMPLFVPTPLNQRLKRSRAIMRKFVDRIITERRREGLRDDLLSMLMSAKDADTGAAMTDDELHDEIIITIFAGHETTASLLTWTFYLLAKHPEVEAKLHAELAQVLGGKSPTVEDLDKLTYTRMVLDEVLRHYSPVPIVARDAAEDTQVGGAVVPKGSMVVIMPYALHRHPEFWEKPLDFYPEHFAPEAAAKRPRYAYIPFGSGQRICLGMHFALLEATLILGDLAQRYTLRRAEPGEIGTNWIGVLRPAKPILMRLEPR